MLIHSRTRQSIEQYLLRPSHALLLVGPYGSGKLSLAHEIGARLLSVDDIDNHPYVLAVNPPEGESIGIDHVRQLESFLNLKVPGASTHNRLVVISDADRMTVEAQNALLKSLEEPPAGTVLIMTVSHGRAILPTLISRLQQITVARPSRSEIIQYFNGLGYDEQSVQTAYSVSGGLPGLMHSMLTQNDHDLLRATSAARQFLSSSLYERLIMTQDLTRDKDSLKAMLHVLQQMAHVSLAKADSAAAKKWHNVSSVSYEAADCLQKSAQPKLVSTYLALNI